MSSGGTRINPYFQSNRNPTRGNSQNQVMPVKAGGYRFHRQASPDSKFSETSSYKVLYVAYQTPTSYQIEKVHLDVSADERLLHNNPSTKPQDASNLRKSPSFRLKNYRHITPGQRDDGRRTNNKSTNLQNSMISQEIRKNRMTALESFYQQLGTDEDASVPLIKNTQPVKKTVLATPTCSSQTTSVPKHNIDLTLEERDANIEEVHFFLVETQQKYKSWLENIERKNKR